MVVTDLPTADSTFVWQERTAWPSSRTVHAPHIPIPQPYLEPFRSRTSRRTQSNGVSGSTSTVETALLTFSLRGIAVPCLRRMTYRQTKYRPVLEQLDRKSTRLNSS